MITAPVTWAADNLDGTPVEGVIEYRPAPGIVRYTDPTGARLKIGPIIAVINPETGLAVTDLPVTDQAGLDPAGWTWQVTERLRNTPARSYPITVTLADTGAGVTVAGQAPTLTTLGLDSPTYATTPTQTEADHTLAGILDHRNTQRVTIAVMGDSIGQGVVSDNPTYATRSLALLQTKLRLAYPTDAPGAAGYIPAYHAGGLLGTPPTLTAAGGNPIAGYGPGDGSALYLNGPNGAAEWPALAATRIRVHYGKSDFLVYGFKVLIDGIDRTTDGTIAGVDSPALVSCVAGPEGPSDGYTWQSPPLAPGPHTVKVVADGFGAIVEGVEFLDGDEDKGIHLLDCTHSGATAAGFAGAPLAWQAITHHAPQVALITLGTNDALDRTKAQFKADLETIITKLTTAGVTRIILAHPYRPARASTGADATRWGEHRQARAEVAAAHPTVRLFDIQAYWPILNEAGTTNEGLMYETAGLHLTNIGQKRYADVLTRPFLAAVPALTGATGPAGPQGPAGFAPSLKQWAPTVGSTYLLNPGPTTTGNWGAAGHSNFTPVVVPAGGLRVDQMGFNVTTAGAAGLVDVGLYKVNGTNLDRVLLVGTNIDCSTTGWKMQTVAATTLAQGVYFMGFRLISGTAPSVTLVTVLPAGGFVPYPDATWGARILNTPLAATHTIASLNNAIVINGCLQVKVRIAA